MKAWYQVRSPEGYIALELADGEFDARQKAAKRPGYSPEDSVKVKFYKAYIPVATPPPEGWRERMGKEC